MLLKNVIDKKRFPKLIISNERNSELKVRFRHFLTTCVKVSESPIKKLLFFTDLFAKPVDLHSQNSTTEVMLKFGNDISFTGGYIDVKKTVSENLSTLFYW